MASLLVNIDGVEYTDKYCGMNIGYEQTILDATVFVDGSDLINHFNVSCDSDWVDIQRVRNEITFVISKNNTLDERNALIEFTHNLDSEVYIRLGLCQSLCDYTITVDQDHLVFDTLLDYNDSEKVETTINVTTLNGIRDFGVGPVAEYVRNFEFTRYLPNDLIFEDDIYYILNDGVYEKGTTITNFPYIVQETDEYYYYEVRDMYRPNEIIHEGQKYWYKSDGKYKILTADDDIIIPNQNDCYYKFTKDYAIKYDNGLKIIKVNNKTLKLINYGKICLYDDFFYILTLYHINNTKSMVQIRIDYVDSFDNNESGFDLDDGE